MKNMNDDSISRRSAIDALNRHLDTIRVVNNNIVEMIRRSEVMDCREIINGLPSAQPEHLVKESGNLVKGLVNDCISRQEAIDAIDKHIHTFDAIDRNYLDGLRTAMSFLKEAPSAHPERMTNRQWVDFLSAQFDISRTSAKEMLHGMMRWKKEDNFKKMFNGGRT